MLCIAAQKKVHKILGAHRLIYCFRPFVTCVMCSFHSKKCFDAFQSISIIFGIYQEILHFCSSAYNFVHWEWLTNHWIPWLNENYSICRSLDWRAIECGRFKLNSNCNVATHFKKKTINQWKHVKILISSLTTQNDVQMWCRWEFSELMCPLRFTLSFVSLS